MELTRYLKTYPSPDKPGRMLLFATRRCAVLECSEALWERVRDNGELTEKESATLGRLGVLVPDSAAEQEEMRTIFESVNSERRPFTLLVTLTLECNLACPYCFEDPFRGRFRMSAETADLLVERVRERMAAGQDIMIDFYGGEALMALPLLTDIAERVSKAARGLGVKFGFTIITNGTLLSRERIAPLLPLGLESIRVTVDGPPDVHDRQRPFVSGRGSFDAIMAGLAELRGVIRLDLVGNYTPENYRRFPELLDHLLTDGFTPFMIGLVAFFAVMPKADGSVPGDFANACACSDEPWQIEAGLYLRGEILGRGFNTPRLRMAGCMVEFADDLVVGYDGGYYKCPAFMGDESLRAGSLAEGIGDYRESHNLDLWKTDECLDCAYLPLCFGGCRFFRKLKTGAIDGVECRRAYLDAALERIVRQDLELRPRGA